LRPPAASGVVLACCQGAGLAGNARSATASGHPAALPADQRRGGGRGRRGADLGPVDDHHFDGRATPQALVESAVWEASLFEEVGFRDFKISVKHHDPAVMVEA
jgi:hypothetical protein